MSAEFSTYYYADFVVMQTSSHTESNFTLFKPDINRLMDLSAVDSSSIDDLEDAIVEQLSTQKIGGRAVFDGKKMAIISVKRAQLDS